MIRSILVLMVACFASISASGDITSRDTTNPNTFWFTSDVYYVEEDASNAVISVEFAPGNRSWSGSVNYTTTNGTAIAGADYTAVSGTLYFSGPGTPIPRIIIPISNDKVREGDETLQIILSNPDAYIPQNTATLVIRGKRPVLKINQGQNGMMSLTWPSEDSDFVLEKSSDPAGANWTAVSSARSISNGACAVSEPCSTSMVFYRLRKTTAP